MKMGLFKKISDIISANLGEMAESFEDPEKMLKQAVREMGETIQEATKETAKALASEK
jgi:phage shock protein A